MNEEVHRKKDSQNIEKDKEDTSRIMIPRAARFSMNEEASLRKKNKTCNKEALALKLEKGNNLRIFCSKTAFEGLKEIILKTQLAKATK